MNLHNQTDQEDEETGEKPLPYSPISGFLNLPPDEEIPAGIHPSYSDNYMSRGDDHDLFFYESTDELEEEESTNLDTLGLQVGPFQQSKETRLSKHTSSQTLKAQSASIDKSNNNESLDWSEAIPYQGQVSSNTWSTSSSGVKAISNALKLDNDTHTSSTLSVSKSLPSESHLQQQSVKESWDDDFLFQDEDNEDAAISSLSEKRNETEKLPGTGRGEWDDSSEEDEEDDWTARSVGEGRIPASNSASTIQPLSREDVKDFDHLEQSRPINRDLPPIATQSSISKSGLHKAVLTHQLQTPSSVRRNDRLSSSSEAEQATQHDLEKAKLSQHHRTTSAKASPSSFRKYTPFRSEESQSRRHSQIMPKEDALEGASDSPYRPTSRTFDGHWSHFLSSRLGHSRSPERRLKSKQAERHENEIQLRSDVLSSPTVPLPTSEPSTSHLRDIPNSIMNSNDVKTDRRKAMHRKGGTSLSMSFGITAPWGNMNRSSTSRYNNLAAASVGKSSATSMSSAPIKADSRRLKNVSDRHDSVDDKSQSSVMDSRTAPLSTVKSQRNLIQSSKRKLSMADIHIPRRSDENSVEDSTKPISIFHRPHSPTSFRGPQIMLTSRSHSGSTSTATSAMTSSDYATSTGSMTEESTLYGSIGDASALPAAPFDHKSAKSHSRGNSITKIVPLQLTAQQQHTDLKLVKKVPSPRRIRVSTSKSLTASDQILSTEFPTRPSYEGHLRSTTDVQVRLPSDPISSSSSAKKGRNSSSTDSFARRNSLGDLRIPSRITKAQEGIRANMNRVKDFASGIEELKLLRNQYQVQISKISIADPKRLELEEEFGSWWECAEVLIGLGEGKGGKDDETEVTSLDQVLPFSRDSYISRKNSSDQYSQRPSPVSSSQSQASVSRSSRGMKPASSRASSSRSIDPQREIDILAAMLAGTPVEDISPIRAGITLRERTQSVNESRSGNQQKTIKRQAEPQGRLPLAGVSATSLTFADEPPKHSRSRSHRASQPVNQANLAKQASDRRGTLDQSSTTLIDIGAMSSESIDTQGVGRKRRLRSTGKAGLQGLKDLLRTFKMNSSALPYQGGTNQSRASLARILTSDSRTSLHDHDKLDFQPGLQSSKDSHDMKEQSVADNKTKSHSRTRSIFSKSLSRSASRSPILQRYPISTKTDDSSSTSSRRCSVQDANFLNTANPSASFQSITKEKRAISADSSTKDISLDSDWTQGDFDHISLDNISPNSMVDPSYDEMDASLRRSSTGRKRFFLFSKGFPPSAAKRHNRDVLQWASSSRDSLDKSPQRYSLFSPSVESASLENSSPGMPRTTSSSKHPLLLTEERMNRRSVSNPSSGFSVSPISAMQHQSQRPTVRSSNGSNSAATVSTMDSASSGSTQLATPNTESFRDEDDNMLNSRRVSSIMTSLPNNPPPPPSPPAPSATYRKLALKPEAIPSLLLYLETTKARCRESLILLGKGEV